uniref:RING-type E3 ubiquitin transferase n=1 Tax=Mesocestoides corti TaxID=53468 RepID=A0A5K3EVQ8_MESCO
MSRPPTCHFYQAGSCLNGDSCAFYHPTQRCRSFTADGWCPYGVHCHFWHDPENSALATEDGQPVQKICRFFLNGQCSYGEMCAYSHQVDDLTNGGEFANRLTLAEYRQQRQLYRQHQQLQLPSHRPASRSRPAPLSPAQQPTSRAVVPRPTARLEQAYVDALQPGDLEKMRELEVDRLLKRFPPTKLKHISGTEDVESFSLMFSSSDPDWSHEIKSIIINITLPPDYPLSRPVLKVPRTSDLPSAVTNHLNEAIDTWVNERQVANESANKVALFLRAFLFWLDKKLNELLTAGYSLVSENDTQELDGERLFPISETFSPCLNGTSSSSSESSSDDEDDDDDASTNRMCPHNNTPDLLNLEATSDDESETEAGGGVASGSVSSATVVKQEVTFEGLDFRGQAGTCLFVRLPVSCTCSRCKYVFDWVFRLPGQQIGKQAIFKSTPPYTTACPRCKQPIGLEFEASLVHGFSPLIGTFELANCVLSDVQIRPADAMIHCTNCSSDVKTTGLQQDRVNTKRCQNCHSLCGILFTDITISKQLPAPSISRRFAGLSIGQTSKTQKDGRPKTAVASNVPFVLQKGTPLPNNGACKHYRKSFRWLRYTALLPLLFSKESPTPHDLLTPQAYFVLPGSRVVIEPSRATSVTMRKQLASMKLSTQRA